MKAPRPPRGRPRPASDPVFAPQGGEEGLRNALNSLLQFGEGESLNGYRTSLMKEEITDLARSYNWRDSDDGKAPRFSRIQSELEAVENAAKLLSARLKDLHDVSLAWLTGDVHISSLPEWTRLQSWRWSPAAEGDGSRGPGPGDQLYDETFDRALGEAFGLQWVRLKLELKERCERATKERSEAWTRIKSAEDEATSNAAANDYFAVEPELVPRRDMTDPLAEQMAKLAYVAKEARKNFEAGFGRTRDKKNALAIASPGDRLARECFDLIRCFFGPSGVVLITQTSTALFSTFVKDVADYASGHEEMGAFELDTAIDNAVIWGRTAIEKRRQAGEDPFREYTLAKERRG